MKQENLADQLYFYFLKALSTAGPLKMFVAWAVGEQTRARYKKRSWTWDDLEEIEVPPKDLLPVIPKKEKVTPEKLVNRRTKHLDYNLDDLLKEVLWAIVNQPKDPDYCLSLGIACGLMIGKRMQIFSTSAKMAMPGIISKREMALVTHNDIKNVLTELKINDLQVFRRDKDLRDTFFNRVDEETKTSRGYTLSRKRVMDVARFILK